MGTLLPAGSCSHPPLESALERQGCADSAPCHSPMGGFLSCVEVFLSQPPLLSPILLIPCLSSCRVCVGCDFSDSPLLTPTAFQQVCMSPCACSWLLVTISSTLPSPDFPQTASDQLPWNTQLKCLFLIAWFTTALPSAWWLSLAPATPGISQLLRSCWRLASITSC